MKTHLLALAALLASTAASADTLVSNVNGIQADANGNLERFTGILLGSDGVAVTPQVVVAVAVSFVVTMLLPAPDPEGKELRAGSATANPVL